MIAALAAAALATAAAPTDTVGRIVELRHIYQQSCEVRAYGTFDDLCDQLKKQMREAERAEKKNAARARASVAAKPEPKAIAPTAD